MISVPLTKLTLKSVEANVLKFDPEIGLTILTPSPITAIAKDNNPISKIKTPKIKILFFIA